MVDNIGNVGNNQHHRHDRRNQHNYKHEEHNGNEANHIPHLPTIEGLHQMIRQLQDHNRRLASHMAAMNRENNRRENKASSHYNNDDPTGDEQKNNTYKTHGREETVQMTTMQGSPIYSGPFSEFIMSIALPENCQLPNTLKSYDGTGDPQLHLTKFRSMMLVNGASDPLHCRAFPTFLEKTTLLCFLSLPTRTIHSFAKLLQAFVNRFSSSRVYKKTLNALNAIR